MHTAIVGSGPKPGHWNETDVLTGLTLKFLNDLEFDAFYTAFVSQVDAFDTSTNVDLKLTYHDKILNNKLVKSLSISPYHSTPARSCGGAAENSRSGDQPGGPV